jgi:hypothetical protein
MRETGAASVKKRRLGIAAIAMMGWICALGWLAWRLVNWALF